MGGAKGTKRVKSGCITCRIRRVKCDERHPHCQRCLSTGRKCEGYSALPFSRNDLLAISRSRSASPGDTGVVSRLFADPAFDNLVERRYFQFFRHKSTIASSSLIDTKFWDRIVLQTCHVEPAIRHAVLALSALHQLGQCPGGSEGASQHEMFAERQHQKALIAAQDLISVSSDRPQDFDKILVACVIFITFESVRGNYPAAAIHMNSGRTILRQHCAKLKQTGRRKDLIEIEQALSRLDLAALFFQDASSPYPFDVDDFHRTDPVIVPHCFEDMHDAQACLVDLCRWMLVIVDWIDRIEPDDLVARAKYHAQWLRCTSQVKRFTAYFDAVIASAVHAPRTTTLNLQCWNTFATIVAKADLAAGETTWDAFTSEFETIVTLAEDMAASISTSDPAAMFSYEIGYLAPVYAAATRCRDPFVRRRAIAVMRDYPRQEGVLESTAAASVATAVMQAEERGLEVRCAADVPAARRTGETEIRADTKKGEAHVELKGGPATGEEARVVVRWKDR